MRVTTGLSLLVDRDVMHILTGAELSPIVWEANARATALPIPEELPAAERASSGPAQLHANVRGHGLRDYARSVHVYLSRAVVCLSSLGTVHTGILRPRQM